MPQICDDMAGFLCLLGIPCAHLIGYSASYGGSWGHHMRQSAFNWRNYPRLSDNDWSSIHMPLLMIAGENDISTSLSSLEVLQASCPQSEIMIVPDSGHRPHFLMEHVKDVNLRMLDFLQKSGGGAG